MIREGLQNSGTYQKKLETVVMRMIYWNKNNQPCFRPLYSFYLFTQKGSPNGVRIKDYV